MTAITFIATFTFLCFLKALKLSARSKQMNARARQRLLTLILYNKNWTQILELLHSRDAHKCSVDRELYACAKSQTSLKVKIKFKLY